MCYTTPMSHFTWNFFLKNIDILNKKFRNFPNIESLFKKYNPISKFLAEFIFQKRDKISELTIYAMTCYPEYIWLENYCVLSEIGVSFQNKCWCKLRNDVIVLDSVEWSSRMCKIISSPQHVLILYHNIIRKHLSKYCIILHIAKNNTSMTIYRWKTDFLEDIHWLGNAQSCITGNVPEILLKCKNNYSNKANPLQTIN
jgi:hypothetical protein